MVCSDLFVIIQFAADSGNHAIEDCNSTAVAAVPIDGTGTAAADTCPAATHVFSIAASSVDHAAMNGNATAGKG